MPGPSCFAAGQSVLEIGARETYYTERLEPSSNPALIGTAIQDPINRNVANASLEIRPPTLSKIFDRKPFGRVLKHTVEPFMIYRYQTGIDDFSQIIRFDYRDILVDTNEVEYGVINRLYCQENNPEVEVLSAAEAFVAGGKSRHEGQRNAKPRPARTSRARPAMS